MVNYITKLVKMQEENQNKAKWQEKMGKKIPESPKNEEKMAENGEKSPENEKKLTNEEVLEQKLAESNDKLLRTLAELENTRRRSREEVEKASNYAISGFVGDLVVVAENFFLACQNMPESEDEVVKNFVIGVDMTKKELMKVLERNKVQRVYPLGEQFDHNLHEAVSQVEEEGKGAGEVLQVIQAGYKLGERLLRPALVVVAK